MSAEHVKPAPLRLAGAFAPQRRVAGMDATARRELLARLAEAGLTMLFTEGTQLPPGIEVEARRAGLRLAGGLACFSDHAEAVRPVPDYLRPITPTGARRPQMEWYRGIIPTDPAYAEAVIRACRETVVTQALDLFVLDFIRWPIHWELELRDGAEVIDSSFDPTTLHLFRSQAGVDVPVDDPVAAAARIHAELAWEWAAFKCDVITRLVARIADEVRTVRPELPLGAYIVPGDDSMRRRFAGQDVAAMAAHLDVLLPMTYHAILGRSAGWVGEVVRDISERSGVAVVPVVQATADRDVAAGNDWGSPFPPQVLGEAIDAGLEAGGRGFVIFPAHGLGPDRLALLPDRVSRVPAATSIIRAG